MKETNLCQDREEKKEVCDATYLRHPAMETNNDSRSQQTSGDTNGS